MSAWRWILDEHSPEGTPSLFGQIGATRRAAIGLVNAHIELAKAEFSEILDEVKRLALAAGVAIALVLFVGMLVSVGGVLFLGEWLFGSIGWGVLLGTELCLGIALAAVLGVLGLPGRSIGAWFVFAVLVGVVLGVIFGLALTNQGWKAIGDAWFGGADAANRPLISAVIVVGVLLGIVGFVLALAGTRSFGGAIAGLVGGAILGVLIGAFTAISFDGRSGAGVGTAVALAVWPAGMLISVSRRGIDVEAIKNRLWPNETINTTKETIEWVREQTPLGRKS